MARTPRLCPFVWNNLWSFCGVCTVLLSQFELACFKTVHNFNKTPKLCHSNANRSAQSKSLHNWRNQQEEKLIWIMRRPLWWVFFICELQTCQSVRHETYLYNSLKRLIPRREKERKDEHKRKWWKVKHLESHSTFRFWVTTQKSVNDSFRFCDRKKGVANTCKGNLLKPQKRWEMSESVSS